MSEELSNHDVQDGSKNCEFTEHLKESFQHATKILEEKSDDHPPGEVKNTLFVKKLHLAQFIGIQAWKSL